MKLSQLFQKIHKYKQAFQLFKFLQHLSEILLYKNFDDIVIIQGS